MMQSSYFFVCKAYLRHVFNWTSPAVRILLMLRCKTDVELFNSAK